MSSVLPGTVKVTFLLSFAAGGVRLMPLVSWISILHPKVFVSSQPMIGSSNCEVTSKYWLGKSEFSHDEFAAFKIVAFSSSGMLFISTGTLSISAERKS